MEGTVLIFVNM